LYDLTEQTQNFNNNLYNNNNNNNNNTLNSTPLNGRTIQQQSILEQQTPDRLQLAERNMFTSSPRPNLSASKKRGLGQMLMNNNNNNNNNNNENQTQQQSFYSTTTTTTTTSNFNTPSKKQKMIQNLPSDTSSPMMDPFEKDVPLHVTSVSSTNASSSKHQKTPVVKGILEQFKGIRGFNNNGTK